MSDVEVGMPLEVAVGILKGMLLPDTDVCLLRRSTSEVTVP